MISMSARGSHDQDAALGTAVGPYMDGDEHGKFGYHRGQLCGQDKDSKGRAWGAYHAAFPRFVLIAGSALQFSAETWGANAIHCMHVGEVIHMVSRLRRQVWPRTNHSGSNVRSRSCAG